MRVQDLCSPGFGLAAPSTVGAVLCREMLYSDFGAEEHQGFTHRSLGAMVPPVALGQPGKILTSTVMEQQALPALAGDAEPWAGWAGWKSGPVLALENSRDGGEQENPRCVQEVAQHTERSVLKLRIYFFFSVKKGR